MKTDNEPILSDQSLKSRKSKSREVSSRFLSPPTPSQSNNGVSSRSQSSSLLRQHHKPTTTDARKHRSLEDSGFMQGLWPSSSNNKSQGTLADHLRNERHEDNLERKKDEKTANGSNGRNVSGLSKQQTFSEFSRFENEKEIEEKEKQSTKENHKLFLGGSMRYMGKFRFPGMSSLSSSSSSTLNSLSHNSDFVPGRLSVDEYALYRNYQSSTYASRRKSFVNNPDSESEVSDISSSTASPAIIKSSRKLGREVTSKYLQSRQETLDSNIQGPVSLDSSPKMKKLIAVKNAIKRTNSLNGSAVSPWALSPGRSESPSMSVESKERLMSFSSLKPPTSPSRPKGVEKLLNLGFDLFRSKKSSLPSSPLAGVGNGESIHQLRMLHNRLMQWRYVNARADAVNDNINKQVENNMLCALQSITKLQHSVLTKKLQLQKQKLGMKLDLILYSQIKPLEAWGDMERKHLLTVSRTKECLHSAIYRVPLVEGAKVDPQLASLVLRYAQDLTTSVKSVITTFSPSAEKTVTLLSQLAEVVVQEKKLLEECQQLLQTISALETQERSLKSYMIQFSLWKQQQQQQQQGEEKVS